MEDDSCELLFLCSTVNPTLCSWSWLSTTALPSAQLSTDPSDPQHTLSYRQGGTSRNVWVYAERLAYKNQVILQFRFKLHYSREHQSSSSLRSPLHHGSKEINGFQNGSSSFSCFLSLSFSTLSSPPFTFLLSTLYLLWSALHECLLISVSIVKEWNAARVNLLHFSSFCSIVWLNLTLV